MINLIYYKFYNYCVRFSDRDDHPHWLAASLSSGMLTLNALTFMAFLELFDLHFFNRSTFSSILIALIMFAFMYYKVLYKDKYLQIVNFYHSRKNKTRNFLYNLVFGFYLLASLIIMIYITYLPHKEAWQ